MCAFNKAEWVLSHHVSAVISKWFLVWRSLSRQTLGKHKVNWEFSFHYSSFNNFACSSQSDMDIFSSSIYLSWCFIIFNTGKIPSNEAHDVLNVSSMLYECVSESESAKSSGILLNISFQTQSNADKIFTLLLVSADINKHWTTSKCSENAYTLTKNMKNIHHNVEDSICTREENAEVK